MQRGKKKKENNSQYFKLCHLTSRLILSLLYPHQNAFSTWASHQLVKGLFIKGSTWAKGLHLLRKISKQIHK